MTRPIKFRAWDNIMKEWLLGYEYPNLGGFSIVGETMMMGEWSSVLTDMLHGKFGERGEELKIMQYTGISDKNGKEIYEGDILEYEDEHGLTEDFIEPVEWIEDEYTAGFGTENSANVWAEVARLSKVIGNIYENPELLEK